MKISNAIAIIALGLQGFLLHTDAASHSPFGLRGGVDSTLADYDTTDDPGYDYAQHLPSRDGQDYPDESEFAVNFDEDEAATDFVLESSGKAGTGVYLQGLPGATRHGARCRFPFPACGRGYHCMDRRRGNPICVDRNRCIPSGVIGLTNKEKRRCCNGWLRSFSRPAECR